MKARFFTLLGLLLSGIASAQDKSGFASFLELPTRYVIGGYANGQWLKSEAVGKLLTADKTEYRAFTLKGESGKVFAAKAAPGADVCPDVWMHNIAPEPRDMSHAVAVNAPWNPMPRSAKATDVTQVIYVNAVRDLLLSKGIGKPQVKIVQLLRVDVDGDGTDEVFITATHYANAIDLFSPKAGDYSFIAMRRLVAGKVQTQIIDGNFYPKADELAAPNTFELEGLLDLDGDGKLEVISRSTYYEGGGTQVWQLNKDTLVQVLAIECGV